MVNWKQILMVATAIGAVVAGICILIVPLPAILAGSVMGVALVGALSGGIVAGGVQAMMCAFSAEASWVDFFKEFGLGFIIGAATSLFSAGASAVFTSISISLGTGVEGFFVGSLVRIFSSVALSATTEVIKNVWHGRKWNENWRGALKLGAILGVISCGVFAFQHANLDGAMEWAKRITS